MPCCQCLPWWCHGRLQRTGDWEFHGRTWCLQWQDKYQWSKMVDPARFTCPCLPHKEENGRLVSHPWGWGTVMCLRCCLHLVLSADEHYDHAMSYWLWSTMKMQITRRDGNRGTLIFWNWEDDIPFSNFALWGQNDLMNDLSSKKLTSLKGISNKVNV